MIHIGRGKLRDTAWHPKSGRAVVIGDPNVHALSTTLARALNAPLLELPPGGERIKTRETKAMLEDLLIERGFGRDTTIVAVGGGVTTDLVGFLAATYLRGVPLILIPTTLLAMVDAAIGAKTSVNTPKAKNLIGTFYEASAVVVDPDVLGTLSEPERLHGMAEMMKIGLTSDRALWDAIQRQAPLDELIERAIRAKQAVLAHDPQERGPRRVLNFGHTVGHALEQVSGYELPHGQGVLLGCVTESFLSAELGILSQSELAKILAAYQGMSLRLPQNYARKTFLDAMAYDKKNAGHQIRCVLLEAIGRAASFDGAYCIAVERAALEAMAAWMEARYG